MSKKEFQANIYTPDWRFIAVLTDYISMIWTDRYYEAGDFELTLPLTKENLQIYAVDNYIICNQSDKVMIIEEVQTSVSSSGYKLRVKGHSAEILLKRRVIPCEFVTNAFTNNEKSIRVGHRDGGYSYSKFAGQLAAAFEKAFGDYNVPLMQENSDGDIIYNAYEPKHMMNIIRFAGVIADPFNHISDAIANIDANGEEYYDVIQSQCESKDIGFAIYRNFDVEIDRSSDYEEDEEKQKIGRAYQANTNQLFDLVLYDGWNRTIDFMVENGNDMTIDIAGESYVMSNGIIFSVEYLNLLSSDSSYSSENEKNYIYVKGAEVDTSAIEVDVASNTANFTKAYTGKDPIHYQIGTGGSNIGIFRKETFIDSGIDRGSNTRHKYANRLRAIGEKELKKNNSEWTLSAQITNVTDYIYGTDYYLGDIVTVKDSMDNQENFRVTEEIISSDANGLVMYPTLVKYDPDKYVEDDAQDVTNPQTGARVTFDFNGGFLGKYPGDTDAIQDIFMNLSLIYYDSEGRLKSHIDQQFEIGQIIDTDPHFPKWLEKSDSKPNQPNIEELIKNLEGVITYQEVDDFIVFPELLGTPNYDPNEVGDYKVTYDEPYNRVEKELRYWAAGNNRRFIPYRELLTHEEGTICTGNTKFEAHWVSRYYRIAFEHGEGGKYQSWDFGNSYCKITDIEEYSEIPPAFNSGTWYKKTRTWDRDDYDYVKLYITDVPGWDVPGSTTYYDHYYTTSKKLDVIFKEFEYGIMLREYMTPNVLALPNYTRANPKWNPTLTAVTQDATYTAQWIANEQDKDEEEPDEDWDDDDDGGGGTQAKAPVKHKAQKTVYVGDSEKNVTEESGMASFRILPSRVGDKFGIQNGSFVKIRDGKEQHERFVYEKDIGNGCIMQVHWWQLYGGMPAISILRTSDWAVIALYTWGGSTDTNPYGSGYPTAAAFTTTPSIRVIKGYKALTENIVGDEDEWPTNKIFSRRVVSGVEHFDPVTERPANWNAASLSQGNWQNYYTYGQVGASYGFCCQGYDDLGIIFSPLWTRMGIIDWPIVSVPYDTKYTENALDIATYLNRSYARSVYTASGWKWVDIPDGRWYGKNYDESSSEITGEKPKFVYNSVWGAMYNDAGGNRLVHMPDDWETGTYYYSIEHSRIYQTIHKPTGWAPTGISWVAASVRYGPHFYNVSHGGTGYTRVDDFSNVYYGISDGGGGIPLPKLAGDVNSIIIYITGQTRSQHVKPGEVATFKVNAISLVLGSKLEYFWEIKYPGQADFTSIGSLGSSYSFKTSSDQTGTELRCMVKCSYSIFGTVITGQEYSDTMILTVDNSGTDGKPAPKDPTDEEAQKPTEEASQSSSGGASAGVSSGGYPEGNAYGPTVKNSDGTTSTAHNYYKWVGDGAPPEEYPTTIEEYESSDDWEFDPDHSGTITHRPSTGGDSGGTSGTNLNDTLDTYLANGLTTNDLNNPGVDEALGLAQTTVVNGANEYANRVDEAGRQIGN